MSSALFLIDLPDGSKHVVCSPSGVEAVSEVGGDLNNGASAYYLGAAYPSVEEGVVVSQPPPQEATNQSPEGSQEQP